jgi:hypothetical protein
MAITTCNSYLFRTFIRRNCGWIRNGDCDVSLDDVASSCWSWRWPDFTRNVNQLHSSCHTIDSATDPWWIEVFLTKFSSYSTQRFSKLTCEVARQAIPSLLRLYTPVNQKKKSCDRDLWEILSCLQRLVAVRLILTSASRSRVTKKYSFPRYRLFAGRLRMRACFCGKMMSWYIEVQ